MMPATIRTFFACELSNDNLGKINHLLADLKASLPRSVKWVSTNNMHLTLKFIGELKTPDVANLQTAFEESLGTFKSFPLKIKGMGAFPSLSKPSVVWLGIQTGDRLGQLVKVVNEKTEHFGYPTERRPFSAHITLGRVKPYATREEIKMITDKIVSCKDLEIGNQEVDSLVFFQSDLTPKGPVYKVLFKQAFIR